MRVDPDAWLAAVRVMSVLSAVGVVAVLALLVPGNRRDRDSRTDQVLRRCRGWRPIASPVRARSAASRKPSATPDAVLRPTLPEPTREPRVPA
jgi:hypothetical protein